MEREAFERARSAYGTGAYDDATLEFVFPQLKESEDERSRKWILEYLYDGLRKADEQFKGQFKTAIAYIEKQKEQKPVEWSEEEKNKIESIKTLVTIGRFDDINTIKTIWELLDSLSHSWKPSEEQMKALKWAIEYLADIENDCASALTLLEFDIQKLL